MRKLRVPAERLGVHPCSLRITLTLDLLRIAVGVGNRDLSLTICICANFFAFRRAGGAQLIRYTFAFRLHPPVHRFGNRIHVIHPRDAYVDDIDAPRLLTSHGLNHFTLDIRHQSFTLGRQQVFHSSLVDLLLKRIADHPIELHGASGLIEPNVSNVLAWLRNAPTYIPVNDNPLFLSCQHGLGVRTVQSQKPLVDVSDVLKRWGKLEIETRLGNHFFDLPKRVQNTELSLIHNEEH